MQLKGFRIYGEPAFEELDEIFNIVKPNNIF